MDNSLIKHCKSKFNICTFLIQNWIFYHIKFFSEKIQIIYRIQTIDSEAAKQIAIFHYFDSFWQEKSVMENLFLVKNILYSLYYILRIIYWEYTPSRILSKTALFKNTWRALSADLNQLTGFCISKKSRFTF